MSQLFEGGPKRWPVADIELYGEHKNTKKLVVFAPLDRFQKAYFKYDHIVRIMRSKSLRRTPRALQVARSVS